MNLFRTSSATILGLIWYPALAGPGSSQQSELPVLVETTGTRPTTVHSAKLTSNLRLPPSKLFLSKGRLTFIDPDRFLNLPVKEMGATPSAAAQIRQTRNLYPGIPVNTKALDLDTIGKTQPIADSVALKLASDTLSNAGLSDEKGIPAVAHTYFTTVTKGSGAADVVKRVALDTQVHYQFTRHELPLVGPGAQIQLHIDGTGTVTRFHYSTRHLEDGLSVKLITPEEAKSRFAGTGSTADLSDLKLVYWSPPLTSGSDPNGTDSPTVVIPWYRCASKVSSTDPASHQTRTTNSRIRMIPATDDPRYVPSIKLTTMVQAPSTIRAQAAVTGGRAPYRFFWGGSNSSPTSTSSSTFTYTPTSRPDGALDPRLRTIRDEHVTLTVIDANGITAQANQTVRVMPRPIARVPNSDDLYAGLLGGMNLGSRMTNGISYGIESPNDPGPSSSDGSYTPERVAFQLGMSFPGAGGGVQSVCWLEDDSWPGDFIEPNPAGRLPANAVVNGDADVDGINTASIVLYNGDGAPDGFCEMEPGAGVNDYNTGNGSSLNRPGNPGGTVSIRNQNYNVNYSPSWGPIGPNDNLYWLCFYACQILENLPTDDAPPWSRWYPAFNGLHSMLGFASPASDNGVDFMFDFPFQMLGVFQTPQTVVQAWINSALSNDMGSPAALGQLWFITSSFAFSDYGDYYWGKGPVNLTIPPSLANGWWYIEVTNS